MMPTKAQLEQELEALQYILDKERARGDEARSLAHQQGNHIKLLQEANRDMCQAMNAVSQGAGQVSDAANSLARFMTELHTHTPPAVAQQMRDEAKRRMHAENYSVGAGAFAKAIGLEQQ